MHSGANRIHPFCCESSLASEMDPCERWVLPLEVWNVVSRFLVVGVGHVMRSRPGRRATVLLGFAAGRKRSINMRCDYLATEIHKFIATGNIQICIAVGLAMNR